MSLSKKFSQTLTLGVLLLSVAACSSKPPVEKISIHANPQEEIKKLEEQINTARLSQVDSLSPTNFKEAIESYEDAKKLYSKGRKNEKVLSEIALSRAYLTEANSVSELANSNIEQIINVRKSALDNGAPTHFSKSWEKVEREFRKLTLEMENNKYKNIPKKRDKLLNDYLDLELKSIKANSLSETKSILDRAKKNHAKKFAPKSLAIAEKNIADVESFITANRHNSAEIEQRVAEAKRSVEQLERINTLAQTSKNMTSEERAIEFDKKAVEAQKVATLEDKLSLTQSALEKERTSKSYLESQKELQQKYENAIREFGSNEAEVFKQGDALVIRLKGLDFKTGKSEITDTGIDLLYKVVNVLKDFGNSFVLVEGHTDSTGSAKTNKDLSTKRAYEVAQFLQRNSQDITHMEHVGYGFDRPISSNKSAEGRAANRRVDVIIRPSK